MKVVVEINSSYNFDYEHLINWLNDQLSNGQDFLPYDISGNIVSVDGENKY